MTLRIVGAGLGRTGTTSLKQALEILLGGRCYHMSEVFDRPDDIAVWQRAMEGELPDWAEFLADFDAVVDWPTAAFWRELHVAFPDAVVLLSSRANADAWWKSAHDTIFQVSARVTPSEQSAAAHAQMTMVRAMLTNTFTPNWSDADEAKRAYEAHNAAVRASVPADRLVDWQPGDGWGPICAALSLPEPDQPFPHVNSTAEFRAMTGLDG